MMWLYVPLGLLAVPVLASLVLVQRVPRLHVKDKVVLLTGGSAGIGLELAIALVAKGARVAIAARRRAVLVEAVAEIKKRSGVTDDKFITFVEMDVADAASAQAGVDAVRFWAGRDVDVCICNAGYSLPSRFLDIPQAHQTGMVDVNFHGCANVCRAVLPRMYERKSGRVVLVSSMAGTAPVAGFTVYGATKAAIRAFAQSLDMESAARGVRVQVVNPPDVATPGYEEENKTKSPECLAICAMGGVTPMKPAEFAAGVLAGIENYSFQVNVGFDGNFLAMGTAGMDPPTNHLWFIGEVVLGGLLRLVCAVYVYLHYGIVRGIHRKEGIAKQ
jgi:3-dehydrosphinganine reductase